MIEEEKDCPIKYGNCSDCIYSVNKECEYDFVEVEETTIDDIVYNDED